MIHLSTSLKYYKRPDVQEAMVRHSTKKEVAPRFGDSFGKRPDVLSYPGDVLEFAKKGATSFHCSEEMWSNPLNLQPLMNKRQLDDLRVGWDLILDVDYKAFEYSRIATELIVKALRHHGVKSITAKFSGNKGFHVAVPFEAFPREYNGTPMQLLFPDATRRIAHYISEKIQTTLMKQLIECEKGDLSKVAEKMAVPIEHLKKVDSKNLTAQWIPESFMAIDTGLVSSRHMYRMPYSLHEKSGLVSVPVDINSILSFERDTAATDKFKFGEWDFMDRESARPSEAAQLFTDAFDATFTKPQEESEQKEYEMPAEAVPEKFFPPCINKLLNGVEDGRKRTLFILINFLSSCGWSYDAIEARLKEWNKKNKEPIHETYLVGQLRYHKQQRKKILPPNCSNQAYYQDLRVKCPEEYCKFKNPVNYARKRAKL